MAKNKDKKEKEASTIPVDMVCMQKIGGGSFRLPNRIIKSGQNFWCYPEMIPTSIKDLFKEVAPDKNAIVVGLDNPRPTFENQKPIAEKFRIEKALDADTGEILTKGKAALYNVLGADNMPLNEAPIRKNKAEELADQLNA